MKSSPGVRRWGAAPRLALLAVLIVLGWFGASRRPATTPDPGATRTAPAPEAAAREAGASATPAGVSTPERTGASVAVGFRSRQRLLDHWRKHGDEFRDLGIRDADAYLAAAQRLRDRVASADVLEAVRADRVVTRYERSTGCFLAFDDDGTIRTFFRPNDGENYFRRQARRTEGR